MDISIKRPILVGGLGLSASLWLLDVVDHMSMDGSLALGAIAIGSGLWWWRRQGQQSAVVPVPQQVSVDRDSIDRALERADQLIDRLLMEDSAAFAQAEVYRTERELLLDSLERTRLNVAIVGQRATGKTVLLDSLQEMKSSALSFMEGRADEADLTLLLVAGDMTASELNQLETLLSDGHQVLVVLNKQDQFAPMDQAVLMDRIQSRMTERSVEVVAIAAKPSPIKVRRYTDSGDMVEFFEQPVADIQALTERLKTVAAEPTPFVMATALRQSKQLQTRIIQDLNHYRRQKAMPVVEQMQWIAAGTAFASPLATLDLLAGVAINGQLVMDLGKLYGQKFTLDQAKTAAATIAELTVKLGLVELATQALGTVLKGHAATYVAGGALQGISAAYLTRLAGLTLIDYFEEQSLLEPAELDFTGLGERLQTLFQQARRGLALKDFVAQAIPHLPTAKVAA